MEAKVNRVLLIDDSEIDTFVSRRVIETAGFSSQVMIKYSAIEALSYLESPANKDVLPEIIFLDINMPFMNGFEFIREFDKLPKSTKGYCKIIVLSSSYHSGDIKEMTSHPLVMEFITKPLTQAVLNRIQQISTASQ
ncbi:MAG: response regulator [Cyclobacteriaceae bacterium]